MALKFIEGFDRYGPTAQSFPTTATLLQQKWTSTNGLPGIIAGLSSTGYAVSLGSVHLLKTLSANFTRAIVGLRFRGNSIGATAGVLLCWQQASIAQCTLRLNVDGTISIVSGSATGSDIQTSTASVLNSSIHTIAADLNFATGAFTVYLDGTTLILSGTGSLSGGTANQIVIGNNTGNATVNGSIDFDDLFIFDTTGSFNNALLLTSPQIVTDFPESDSVKQFTNNGTILGGASAQTASTNAPGANVLFLRRFTASVGQTINSIRILPEATNGTAKYKGVIYSIAEALLSDGTEVTGTTSGVELVLPLVTPQVITDATDYWIGAYGDASVAFRLVNGSTNGISASVTYASGAPSTLPSMSTSQPNWLVYAAGSGSTENWPSESQNPVAGDVSSILSSSTGVQDLYNFPDLPSTVTEVYATSIGINAKKSDSGTRVASMILKSAAVESEGSNPSTALGTSYEWHDSIFDSDPNGTIQWTRANLNTTTGGPKVVG